MRHLSTDLRRNPPKNKRYPPQSLPSLFYAVSSRNWATVQRRARTHPHEVTSQRNDSGDTPLHIACKFQPPVEVIQALSAAKDMTNDDMQTPLHVAASHRCTVEGIQALLQDDNTIASDLSDANNKEADSNMKQSSSKRRIPLALAVSKIGRVPLHYACAGFRGLQVDAFKVLLEATVDACVYMENMKQKDENDDTDLLDWEDAADNQDPNVFTMQDRLGHTPLSLLFKRYRERVKMVIRFLTTRTYMSSSTTAVRLRALQEEMELGDLWQKATLTVCLLAHKTQCHRKEKGEILEDNFLMKLHPTDAAIALMAANRAAQQYQRSSSVNRTTHDNGNNEEGAVDAIEDEYATELESDRKFRLVHSSVSLAGYGCPPEMIRLAMSVYPDQVKEMDEDGNLPIHIAATASSFLPPTESNGSGNNSDEESSFLSFLSTLSGDRDAYPFNKVIRMLLHTYPEAAKIPHGQTGRLPLILAIDAGQRTMDDGIRALLEAYPAALESRKLDHRLYPTILALLAQPKPEKKKKKSVMASSNGVVTFRRSRLNRANVVVPEPSTVPSKPATVPGPLFEFLKAKPDLMQNLKHEN